jgi:hypothetical protein
LYIKVYVGSNMSSVDSVIANMDSLQLAQTELQRYQQLLSSPNEVSEITDVREEELRIAPLVWWNVKEHLDTTSVTKEQFPQYAVMGQVLPVSGHPPTLTENNPQTAEGNTDAAEPASAKKATTPEEKNLCKPVLLNTHSPWSAFLCGSQGSGKSHTLSCMLENCLLDEPNIGKNPHPLAGLVLHYDGSRGSGVCEAAYLCSRMKTRVLVSASNYGNLKMRYEDMARECGGNIEVQKLLIAPKHLDTERVKTLMAVTRDGEAPLYIQVKLHMLCIRQLLMDFLLRLRSNSSVILRSETAD